MIAKGILAVVMAGLWMVITGIVSIGSFAVGYVLGFAILLVMRLENVQITPRKLPSQFAAFVIYIVTLARDIWNSSVDVTKRVLNPKLPINPGLIVVPTQDETASDFTAAFSAHGITITPGELVVDFEGSHTMLVHCLDVEMSGANAEGAQTKRLNLLRRIEGKS